MKELVEVIAKGLVDQPNDVRVHEVMRAGVTVLELSVAPSDMGKIIGKHGRIAKTIRSVVSAAALKEHRRVTVEIL